MGMLLQRNRQRRSSDIEKVEEVVSDIKPKEVEKTDEKPKRKPRTKKE